MRQCIQPGTLKQTHPPDYMVQAKDGELVRGRGAGQVATYTS